MIAGRVNARREAVVEVRVVGPAYSEAIVDAVIDTGFDGDLLLSEESIASLGLSSLGPRPGKLGDGNSVIFDVYRARVDWGGTMRSVEVLSARLGGAALVGMRMLSGFRLTVEAWPGGAVTIEAP